MSNKTASVILAAGVSLFVLSAGCHGPENDLTNTELHMANMENAKGQYGRHLDDMVDNAILADIHFVAHTGELSGTGVARLNRMAHLLNTYGGTVRYETDLADAQLVSQRLDHVREYLTMTGANMDRVQVKTMISGGRGMTARKAVEVDLKGTAKPEGSTTVPMAATPISR